MGLDLNNDGSVDQLNAGPIGVDVNNDGVVDVVITPDQLREMILERGVPVDRGASPTLTVPQTTLPPRRSLQAQAQPTRIAAVPTFSAVPTSVASSVLVPPSPTPPLYKAVPVQTFVPPSMPMPLSSMLPGSYSLTTQMAQPVVPPPPPPAAQVAAYNTRYVGSVLGSFPSLQQVEAAPVPIATFSGRVALPRQQVAAAAPVQQPIPVAYAPAPAKAPQPAVQPVMMGQPVVLTRKVDYHEPGSEFPYHDPLSTDCHFISRNLAATSEIW